MKNKRKLIIVFHDMGLGGIQRKVLDITRQICDKHPDTEICICLRNKKGIFLEQLPPQIAVYSPPVHTRRLDMIWFIFWLTCMFYRLKPTHILSFMDLGSIPAILAKQIIFWRKPFLSIGEDILTSRYVYTETRPKIRLKLIQLLYPLADQILVQTEIQKKDLEIIFKNRSAAKIIVSPNWLPLDFPPVNINQLRPIDILFIGRIEEQKNLPRLIRIIKKITEFNPDIKVQVVGEGSQKPAIQKLIRNNHLNCNIKLIPPAANPAPFYLKAKIFILTSDYEGFPLTLLESISCGCYPILHSIPEISLYFPKYANKIIFHDEETAVKLIRKQLSVKQPNVISYYQKKIIYGQSKNIKQYVGFILKTGS